jgi:hypothetical protein
MPPDQLPDFHHALMLSRGRLDAAELAECHGVLCGMICGDTGKTAVDFLAQLETLQLLDEPGLALHEVMEEAFESTLQQLEDSDLQFSLWLPDDDQPLEERTDALSQWCTGFLAGLALGGSLPEISEEASEALDDIQQIARAAYAVLDDDNFEPSGGEEEDEKAFCEIVEYVRIVTLMLREELRGPGDDDAIH